MLDATPEAVEVEQLMGGRPADAASPPSGELCRITIVMRDPLSFLLPFFLSSFCFVSVFCLFCVYVSVRTFVKRLVCVVLVLLVIDFSFVICGYRCLYKNYLCTL